MPDLKFPCPHCNQHLEASPDMFGMDIDCPSCSKQIQVPHPAPTSNPPPPPPIPEMELLVKNLRKSNSLARISACKALVKRGDMRAVPHLIEALSDRDEMVGAYAADALGKLGDRSAIPALETAVGNCESFLVPMHAGAALMELQRTPASRQRDVKEGQDWTSLATGMEFVWVKDMEMWVGKYAVTNGEYRKSKPSHDSGAYKGHSLNGDRQPVVQVNFHDATSYAMWLTEEDKAQLGRMYCRVPTEVEFMTYAQCGDGREYPWGDNWPPMSGQAGNYCGQEAQGIVSSMYSNMLGRYNDGHVVTCDVEKSWANPWGLYGVGGNVWEACASAFCDGAFGAVRGASWKDGCHDQLHCSSSFGGDGGFTRDDQYGFRLVLSRWSSFGIPRDVIPFF